ncbi:hypothetical protein [Pseudolactococcus insecticola]|uniref:Uncharacterized protein n=1 Tax=Pseudolactococcus insecticola TaxID=2709158 RepID=A0A6A0B5Y4_9LACT|nr:hypothetical protein [Lactococcus insecticola]GFH40810.1 hypothetical protein Hs20B_12080 [Lactococcus insecticola]
MDFNNLQNFMSNQLPILLTAVAIILSIKSWKNQKWLELGSVLLFFVIIMSLTKGFTGIYNFFKAILAFFGINLG